VACHVISKAKSCEDGGGASIYNHSPGLTGRLRDRHSIKIPVLGVMQADGESLKRLIGCIAKVWVYRWVRLLGTSMAAPHVVERPHITACIWLAVQSYWLRAVPEHRHGPWNDRARRSIRSWVGSRTERQHLCLHSRCWLLQRNSAKCWWRHLEGLVLPRYYDADRLSTTHRQFFPVRDATGSPHLRQFLRGTSFAQVFVCSWADPQIHPPSLQLLMPQTGSDVNSPARSAPTGKPTNTECRSDYYYPESAAPYRT
jgi:hypothetical protein